jgi:hypothetical protein
MASAYAVQAQVVNIEGRRFMNDSFRSECIPERSFVRNSRFGFRFG